ncbi:MAG: response regulator [Candidatus Melainabacteria bacterium]|nr:response regulator [Candidatus Melainabacteria bacterium]
MINRHILIVEDNDLQHTLYNALSKKFNLSLTMVKSGSDGVAAVEAADKYHLILMDLRLTDMNGCECAKQIRVIEKKRGSHTPIIAVTGHTSAKYQNDCKEAGMDGYLSKPFTIEQFSDTIENWSRKDLV